MVCGLSEWTNTVTQDNLIHAFTGGFLATVHAIVQHLLTCNLARDMGKHKHFVPCHSCRPWRPSDPYRRLLFIPSLPNDRELLEGADCGDQSGQKPAKWSSVCMPPVSVRFSAKEQITFIVLSRASSDIRPPNTTSRTTQAQKGERETLQIVGAG